MGKKLLLICMGLCLCFALLLGRAGLEKAAVLSVAAPVHPDAPVFIIDAGHGGFDGGAVGVGNVMEKDINLQIAETLYTILTVNGYHAIMTRWSDEALDDVVTESVRSRKRRDINARARLVEETDNSVLLSIHQNKFGDSTCHGAQVFFGKKHADSAALASILQDTLRSQLDPENKRVEKPITDSVYLVHTAEHPAVLVECGFLSNPTEAEKLQTAAYQQQVAFAVFSAVVQWQSQNGAKVLA